MCFRFSSAGKNDWHANPERSNRSDRPGRVGEPSHQEVSSADGRALEASAAIVALQVRGEHPAATENIRIAVAALLRWRGSANVEQDPRR